jgi:hypothetical protein
MSTRDRQGVFEEKMPRLVAEVREQFGLSATLNKRIGVLLKEFGL